MSNLFFEEFMSVAPSHLTHFYAFRHSETYRNAKGTEIQGWINDKEADLTEEGIKAAHELGKNLIENHPDVDVIISSDLNRALKTADIVASYYQNKISIIKDDRFREKCHGKWETLSPKIRNTYCLDYYTKNLEELLSKKDRFAKWKVDPLSLGDIEAKLPDFPDKLETIYDVFLRGTAAFKELGKLYEGKKVLISSHGAFNDIMATEAESRQNECETDLLPVYFEPKKREAPKNCAVYHFIWDNAKQELAFEVEVVFEKKEEKNSN